MFHEKYMIFSQKIQKHLDKSTTMGYNNTVVIRQSRETCTITPQCGETENAQMFETLKKLLVEELQVDPDDVTMDAELASDLGINSIELANLIMICEEKFDITIEDDDIHKLVTVGDVVSYLESLQ